MDEDWILTTVFSNLCAMYTKHLSLLFLSGFLVMISSAQLRWQNVDSLYQPLPKSVHVFYTNTPIDTGHFRAFYVIADLKDRNINFTTDTTYKRRLTPSQFYQKNNQPLVVVNCTFFSFETNQNLNLVIRDGKIVSCNHDVISGRGKDTFTYRHVFPGAMGISRKRTADIAYTFTDSSLRFVYATQLPHPVLKDSTNHWSFSTVKHMNDLVPDFSTSRKQFHKWKMQTAVGGGPVLLQNSTIKITNNEELKFAGKAINDKHPRTAMGYTEDNKLVILVIQGRSESASGATLTQEAQIVKDLGCVEALNLDGGGSSCLLVNGKETIQPSDKEGQRAVPAVFMITKK
jgi:exopolysaccharide biosynthesis protein